MTKRKNHKKTKKTSLAKVLISMIPFICLSAIFAPILPIIVFGLLVNPSLPLYGDTIVLIIDILSIIGIPSAFIFSYLTGKAISSYIDTNKKDSGQKYSWLFTSAILTFVLSILIYLSIFSFSGMFGIIFIFSTAIGIFIFFLPVYRKISNKHSYYIKSQNTRKTTTKKQPIDDSDEI